MSLLSLLHVSRSTVNASCAEAAVADIVEKAHRTNPQMGLTGALIFTGSNFAQILEGSVEAVDWIMTSIITDPRHTGIIVADRSPIIERRFAKWSMAYSGRVQFVDRHVRELLDAPLAKSRSPSAKRLANLIHQFAVQNAG
ncbi:BLUF domain-containing protein [Sphingomonas sp. PAMC 26621]|uniref:BLUF domain-containing protein n=1 Tax=Sphingomonas sp. PAMC 26621 TaxID=1112213 RepID=UPI0002898305|nr:BLUF domain-containing protein [Sphingomonas sp. PAMC 26621]